MPGITQRYNNFSDNNNVYQNPLAGSGPVSFPVLNRRLVFGGQGYRIWSDHGDDVSCNHLQKFWSDLAPQARQELLRIDKQTFFEQARKNMYCSRCNGLLLEGFLQIVMYGKSIQQDVVGGNCSIRANKSDSDLYITDGHLDDAQDPSILTWGGLTAARDGTLTLLDCYLYSKSLNGLQNVFNSARARERERELLYPDACGGGGRGWISQAMAGYGRAHGTRETCALHTARLPVETLVDFWSALGEETHQSLLKMKEEDFIERLMYRFDSKSFCRDCRRNVIKEFKELKELKRTRRETRCTSWFCVADTAFQYEVSYDTVQADWHQTFLDAFGSYHHFEWAIGSGEGKSDILEFENVGLSGRVQASGLNLSGLHVCYITLRAWKMDGRCSELCVKAHALRGQQCVHCRLFVGDGFVTITSGESIKTFFEHAEEAEEEEDDDSMDKDGNDFDSECSRPQKHAKSPELARDFLLDAATVIFKEQVEKAFREGTARQNAHSIFVCLALKLLEERVHVACKEIITLEKQIKLLEEEEKEKREEEERKVRRRTKEREKKLRRKERLREKENKEEKCAESNQDPVVPDVSKEEPTLTVDENSNAVRSKDFVSETGEPISSSPLSPDIQDGQFLKDIIYSNTENHAEDSPDGEFGNMRDWNCSFPHNHIKYSCRKPKFKKDPQQDLNLKWSGGRKSTLVTEFGGTVSKYESRYHDDGFDVRNNASKNNRNVGPKFSEQFQGTRSRIGDRFDSRARSCDHRDDYRARPESHITRVRDPKYVNKLEVSGMSKPYYRGHKYNQVECSHEMSGRPKSKIIAGNTSPNIKQVWEPLDSRKKYIRSNSDSDVTSISTFKVEGAESDFLPELPVAIQSDEMTSISVPTNREDNGLQDSMKSRTENGRKGQNGFQSVAKFQQYSEDVAEEDGKLCSSTISLHGALGSSIGSSSNSDNCSSCLSEEDCNTSSSNNPILDSSTTSDSDEASQSSEGIESSHCLENVYTKSHRVVMEPRQSMERGDDTLSQTLECDGTNSLGNLTMKATSYCDNGRSNVSAGAQPPSLLPQFHNKSIHCPMFQAPTMPYCHQSPVSWPATNGMMSFPHHSHYLVASPFGYGLDGNALLMQYGALQHLAPPLLNSAQLPFFQPAAHVNGIGTECAKVPNLDVLKEGEHGSNIQKVAPTIKQCLNSETSEMGNTSFSLFHFGGPVALSAGYKLDGDSLKEVIAGDISPNLSANQPDAHDACICMARSDENEHRVSHDQRFEGLISTLSVTEERVGRRFRELMLAEDPDPSEF
ncbi:unnamed protein product [Fraxinus pennsylvanica]|uniref:Uncharacterized protein n=1 Tax=Fraxinus pennsylvanica TaxID=56036 RepID=A0AAD2A6R3_9LAMI|nr:unnamed protein product [Fraxinus pennsylvanica]